MNNTNIRTRTELTINKNRMVTVVIQQNDMCIHTTSVVTNEDLVEKWNTSNVNSITQSSTIRS